MNYIGQFRVANKRAISLKGYCEQVVEMIDAYTNSPKTRGEMLVPPIDALVESYRRGDGTMLVDRRGRVVANCTLWELINNPEIGVRLHELGSWIVDRSHRHKRINGITIGEHVAYLSLNHESKGRSGVIATVKKVNSLRGLEHIGAKAISYADFPYLAGGTCVCPLSSEYRTGTSCDYRRVDGNGERRNGVGRIIDPNYLLDDSDGSTIPCTLMGFNISRLKAINKRLEHADSRSNFVSLTEIGVLGVDHFSILESFYNSIGVSI